jgi:hypothetical protein
MSVNKSSQDLRPDQRKQSSSDQNQSENAELSILECNAAEIDWYSTKSLTRELFEAAAPPI